MINTFTIDKKKKKNGKMMENKIQKSKSLSNFFFSILL